MVLLYILLAGMNSLYHCCSSTTTWRDAIEDKICFKICFLLRFPGQRLARAAERDSVGEISGRYFIKSVGFSSTAVCMVRGAACREDITVG